MIAKLERATTKDFSAVQFQGKRSVQQALAYKAEASIDMWPGVGMPINSKNVSIN